MVIGEYRESFPILAMTTWKIIFFSPRRMDDFQSSDVT